MSGNKRGRAYRMKAIHKALTEFVTGKNSESYTRFVLKDNGCDESETDALIKSAPATIKPRTKPEFKGEVMPMPLVGGSGTGLTK
jgi:hypothetical protein